MKILTLGQITWAVVFTTVPQCTQNKATEPTQPYASHELVTQVVVKGALNQ